MIDRYDNLSDEEFGRLIRQAVKGREQAARESASTRSGFSKFLEACGLDGLAKAVANLTANAWNSARVALFGS